MSLLGNFSKHSHTVQITSFGGSGTTLLYQFLEEHSVDIPQNCHDWLPWKHLPEPPDDEEVKEGFRALYLFGNPMDAVLSVFRRDYQRWHAENMNMVDDYPEWNDDWELEDFLEQGTDHFRMHQHFRSWTQAERSYPILLLKFDALWRCLSEVFAFLGLPTETMTEFPERRARNSDWTDQPLQIRKGLKRMYGDLHREIEETDELKII